MMVRAIPAGFDCLGCQFCEIRTDECDRNIPTCINPVMAAGSLPADVSECFSLETEVAGDD